LLSVLIIELPLIYKVLKAIVIVQTTKKKVKVLEKKVKNTANTAAIDFLKNSRDDLEKVQNDLLLLFERLPLITFIVSFLVCLGLLFSASRIDIAASLQSGLKIPSGTHLSSAPPLYFERMYEIDSQKDKDFSQTDKYYKKKSLYKQVIPFGEYDQKGLNLNLLSAKFTFLVRAQLEAASLKKANLRGADLSWAWLPSADLENAELNETTLFGTNFAKANLSEANFEDAKLIATIFTNANLANAKNLNWTQLRNTTLMYESNEYIEIGSDKYLCGAKLPEYLIKNKEPWYRELERKWQKDLKGKCDS
jgi:hypothetical protein